MPLSSSGRGARLGWGTRVRVSPAVYLFARKNALSAVDYGEPVRKLEDGPAPSPRQTMRTRNKDVDLAAKKMDRVGYHVRRQ